MNNLKIFIINLNRAKERRLFMINQMKKFGITNYEIVKGIDYKDLTNEFFNGIIDKEKQHYDRNLSKSELACALSHRKVYKKILNQKNKTNIILEDDVILNNDFIRFIRQDFFIPKKVDVLYLGFYTDYDYNSFKDKKHNNHNIAIKAMKNNKFMKFYNENFKWTGAEVLNKKININNYFFNKVEKTKIYGAHAYIISTNSIKKILKENKILNTADDIFTSYNFNRYLSNKIMINLSIHSNNSQLEHSYINSFK